ncbi:MAG: GntR family transcriptional regulator [Verrucomicrobiota bacterium]
MSASIKKTSGVPLAEMTYQSLREDILNNVLSAGEQILEKELGERLGVSRTPVREACVRLEREGLVDIKPRHGIRIKPISINDMAEIYQVLTALESEAARILAARDLSAAQIERLTRPTMAMEQAMKEDDREAWAASDESFHLALVELTGNQRLLDLVLQFWGQAHRARYCTLYIRPKPTDSTRDHVAVVDAICLGNAEKAAEIHRIHRVKGKEAMLSLLEKHRFNQL